MPGATLSSPLRAVIGDKTAKILANSLDLHTAEDLLRHYPRRYAERAVLTPLNELHVGEQVTVMGEIERVNQIPMKQRRGQMVKVVVRTEGGSLTVTFFNQAWRSRTLAVGRRGLFAGKVDRFRGQLQLANPQTQLLDEDEDASDSDMLAGLIPIYPATAKMASWNIAKAVRTALGSVDLGDDPLPADVRGRHGLVGLSEALELVHRPDSRAEVARAHERLKWDEAFPLQVVLAQRRAASAAQPAVPRRTVLGGLLEAFDDRLPFALTSGQRDVSEQIFADLAREHPMHRLLQGEVGSGKTVVALRAMLAVVDSGGQAALLAPTEVLAQQHARTIRALLGPLGQAGELATVELPPDQTATRVALLIGSQSAASRRANLLDAASGAAGIVIGTHALLQENVQFADLGLVVIDEQHRFGVEQREALRAKGSTPPHVLVMTATPIPRTVAMTVYGDLETSMLTELPVGRSPIQTTVVPVGDKPQWYQRIWERIREEISTGRQAYVVCPRIGGPDDTDHDADVESAAVAHDGEDVDLEDALFEDAEKKPRRPAAAVTAILPMLQDGPLAGLRVEMLHGQLPAEVKDDVMRKFTVGEVDVLVATTVIEVGVDVPNATVMVVLDADRFGVSQLHQLRGRVGRGEHPGLCLLATDTDDGSPARERLNGVEATLDGVELARLDLEQRREGDVLGAVQSGRKSTLRLLRLLRDEDIIAAAREEATALVDLDPTLSAHDGLVEAVRALVDTERADYLQKT